MKNNNKFTEKEEREFEKYLQKVEDPNYQGGSYDLPENPTTLEKSKYDICQKILSYEQDNHLTTQTTAEKIKLSVAETEDILHCRIEKFTLDRLVSYASELFENLEVGVIKAENKKLHV